MAGGTIYLYFQNKEDILISVFKIKMNSFIAQVRRGLESCATAPEKLKYLIRMHFSILGTDRNLALFVQIQLRQSHPAVRQAFTEPLREYFRLIENLISEGVATGAFRPDLDVRVTRQMIFGTIDEVATCWVLSRHHYNLIDQVEPVYYLLSHGIASC